MKSITNTITRIIRTISTLLMIPIVAVLLAIAVGCGSGGGKKTEPVQPSITLNKSDVQIPQGYQVMVRASVKGLNSSMIWWEATGGTIAYGDNNTIVYYTAGKTAGNYTITCRSYQDDSIQDNVNVKIFSSSEGGIIIP